MAGRVGRITTVGDPDRGAGVPREWETQMDWNIIEGKWKELKGHAREPVSYTHLTLPTIYSV